MWQVVQTHQRHFSFLIQLPQLRRQRAQSKYFNIHDLEEIILEHLADSQKQGPQQKIVQ
jgi:hypothetical protein